MSELYVHRFGAGQGRHYFGIHGWGGGWRTFEPLAEYLPADATLWSVDLPGYGASAPLSRWWWEDLRDRLVETVHALDAPQLRLIGNCSGAAFGLAAAQVAPERFEHLLLIDPFAFFPWYFKLLVARGPGRLFYATAFENPVGRWMTNRGLAEHRTEDSHLTESFAELDHDVVYQYLRMLRQMPSYDSFGGLSHPIVVAHGEKTFEAVRESVRMWTALWPQSRAIELPGAGHLPIQEATAALAAAAFDLPWHTAA